MKPEQEIVVHKLSTQKRENLVNLATDLRQLSAKAYPGKDVSFVKDEILDQFVHALEDREMRIAFSQNSPTSLEETVYTALRDESL